MSSPTAVAHDVGALEAIYHRRAVRAYRPEPVDDATIYRLLDAAVQAPTAMHQEPWSFVVVQDRATLEHISDRAKSIMVAEASAHRELLRAPGATPEGRHLEMLTDPSFNIFYNAGTLIVICGKPLGQFVVADCWLAAENLMLAATAMGLGTCCIGFALPAVHAPDVKRELGIPESAEPFAAIIVGVPQAEPPGVSRKAPEILRWIRPASPIAVRR
ncbi:MAG TPA: nitroreductase family protein [Gemmatimonadaceae bacterium]|nr:nitroreductase family protein [Gemmatimonadaceae bacterium]